MKNLIMMMLMFFVLVNTSSAGVQKRHGNGYVKHQGINQPVKKYVRHGAYIPSHNSYNVIRERQVTYYQRPYRATSHHNIDNDGGLILVSGLFGYILGASH